jgi:hypothetical protein
VASNASTGMLGSQAQVVLTEGHVRAAYTVQYTVAWTEVRSRS